MDNDLTKRNSIEDELLFLGSLNEAWRIWIFNDISKSMYHAELVIHVWVDV